MKNIEWSKLPFGYQKTAKNVRCHFKNGEWSKPEVTDSEYLTSTSLLLHCIMGSFEGMKAYRGKDGDVRLFRGRKCKATVVHKVFLMPKYRRFVF